MLLINQMQMRFFNNSIIIFYVGMAKFSKLIRREWSCVITYANSYCCDCFYKKLLLLIIRTKYSPAK